MKSNITERSSTLKIASGYFGSIYDLDPANITTMYEYEIIENLFGGLLEYDDHGNLVPDIPESFKWVDHELIFTFGRKSATRSGKVITAEDAAVSLKRTIIFKKTGHGDIRTFLCPNLQLRSIDDACPGIRVDGNQLILTAVSAGAKLYLTSMLESADFSIVTRSALGPDPTNPVIVDFTETSGAYYLEAIESDRPVTLVANPQYHHQHSDMPMKVEIVKLRSVDAAEALRDGRVDLLPASVYLSGADAESVAGRKSSYNVLESLPIQVYMLCFGAQALQKFTAEQRFFVGGLIEKWVLENRSTPESSKTVEFFQGLSDGALTAPQKDQILRLRSSHVRPRFDHAIELWVNPSDLMGLTKFLKDYPEVKVISGGVPAYLRPAGHKPDLYIIQNDSAWTENVTLLGHNFHVGTFHLAGVDGDHWIKDYVNTLDHSARVERLRDLHFELLKTATIYPILVNPYLTISNKAWALPASTLSSGPELWKIRTQR